jgi:alpha-glucosidase
MTDVPSPPDQAQDPWEKNVPGLGFGRDPVRTPMPWDSGQHAGFTDGQPWLPIGTGNREVNVAAQEKDASSMLSLYRNLNSLRRSEPALSAGEYIPIAATDTILAYERQDGARRLLIVLNLSDQPQQLDAVSGKRRLLLSTLLDRTGESINGGFSLRANEGVIAEML